MRISRDRMAEWEHASPEHGLSEPLPDRDYSELNEQDEQLRIWLPDIAKAALEALAERDESSMTVYLTELFASYLYGYHEVVRMREGRFGLYEPSRARYSRMAATPEKLPSLGKNIVAIKVFVPEKIKIGLQTAAAKGGLTLGECTRRIICGFLFGWPYGLNNLDQFENDNLAAAAAWENDDD